MRRSHGGWRCIPPWCAQSSGARAPESAPDLENRAILGHGKAGRPRNWEQREEGVVEDADSRHERARSATFRRFSFSRMEGKGARTCNVMLAGALLREGRNYVPKYQDVAHDDKVHRRRKKQSRSTAHSAGVEVMMRYGTLVGSRVMPSKGEHTGGHAEPRKLPSYWHGVRQDTTLRCTDLSPPTETRTYE